MEGPLTYIHRLQLFVVYCCLYVCLFTLFPPQVVLLLLEGGAEVNPQDCQGNTPLHFASQNGHMESTTLLLIVGDTHSHTHMHTLAHTQVSIFSMVRYV